MKNKRIEKMSFVVVLVPISGIKWLVGCPQHLIKQHRKGGNSGNFLLYNFIIKFTTALKRSSFEGLRKFVPITFRCLNFKNLLTKKEDVSKSGTPSFNN